MITSKVTQMLRVMKNCGGADNTSKKTKSFKSLLDVCDNMLKEGRLSKTQITRDGLTSGERNYSTLEAHKKREANRLSQRCNSTTTVYHFACERIRMPNLSMQCIDKYEWKVKQKNQSSNWHKRHPTALPKFGYLIGARGDSTPDTQLTLSFSHMRKIEQQMNDAVANNKNWQSANTSVHYNEENGVSIVRLHGNKIAEIGDDYLQIFDGGWQSNYH